MKKLLQVLPFALAGAGAIWFARTATTPRSGIEQAAADVPMQHLPAGASRIDYWILPPTTAFSCSASEEEFENWVAQYQRPQMKRREGSTAASVIEPATGKVADVLLENAIQYSWRKDDASLQLTYDRNGQRAYYYGHYR